MESPRRRQASPDAIAGREAAAFVRELNRQLGLWQASSVKLQTMAERLNSTGRSDPALAEEARALFKTVMTEAERFQGLLPSKPSKIAEHNRIQDTRRSFEMISARLRTSLQILGVEPRSE
ncbi:MAG: hypothetical protein EOP18_03500 [Rhizobiaceae bacterium]|nr:MAG: hypothetical protein EOP18_03500 [Rhizobiaceae bacterium]